MFIQRDFIPLMYVLSSPLVLGVYYFANYPTLIFAHVRSRLGT